MEIQRKCLERSTIEKFAEESGLVMVITERGKHSLPEHKYYASFKRAEIARDGVLIGTYGDGATEDQAIQEYAKKISGERLIVNAYSADRKQFLVPVLTE